VTYQISILVNLHCRIPHSFDSSHFATIALKHSTKKPNMAPLSIDERLCKEFLGRFRDCADPTWGFYVYGTYMRPQGPRSTNDDHDESKVQTAVGEL
jgi:hypothetical protein